MLLGFKSKFKSFILDGTKTTTIRGERKDGKRPKPGEILHLYTGLRTKSTEFILRAPCIRTEDVEIYAPMRCPECGQGRWHDHEQYSHLVIAGVELTSPEKDLLAHADGFRDGSTGAYCAVGSFAMMMQFWDGRLPFCGWITYWDYSKAEFER